MVSAEEWRGQRKKSMKLKIKQQEFPNLNNRKKLLDNKKKKLTCVIKVPERENIESRDEKVLKEIMAKSSPNLAKVINLHIQDIKQTPHWVDAKESTPRFIRSK